MRYVYKLFRWFGDSDGSAPGSWGEKDGKWTKSGPSFDEALAEQTKFDGTPDTANPWEPVGSVTAIPGSSWDDGHRPECIGYAVLLRRLM